MIDLCTLVLALASPNPNPAPCVLQINVEERQLGTLLEGLELEGPPIVGPDGKSWPNVRTVAWSPDGQQVAYVALRGNESVAVVGDKELGSFQFANKPDFGATGEQVLFRVGNRKRGNKTEEWWLLSGEGKKFYSNDWIGSPRFSPDGQSIATWVQPGAKIAKDGSYKRSSMKFVVGTLKKNRWTFKEGDKYEDGTALQAPRFTPDSELITTVASKAGEWFVLTAAGKHQQAFDKKRHAWIIDYALADNGKRLALAVMDLSGGGGMQLSGNRNVILFGKQSLGAEYKNAGCPAISPKGSHVAYKFQQELKQGIALDDQSDAEAAWDFVFTPIFSPTGKHFCYVAANGYTPAPFYAMSTKGEASYEGGEARLIVEDIKRKEQEPGATYLEIRDVVWDEAGERTAYRARTEAGWIAVCGKQTSEPYDELGPVQFTADGKLLAFGARTDRALWWRILELE